MSPNGRIVGAAIIGGLVGGTCVSQAMAGFWPAMLFLAAWVIVGWRLWIPMRRARTRTRAD